MKILITPPAARREDTASRIMVQNMIDLFRQNGHAVSVCAPEDSHYRNTELFPAERPKVSFFRRRSEGAGKTYEEYLYSVGALDREYLVKDTETIRRAIASFQPDLMIDAGRTAALIASRLDNIRIFTIVSAPMIRSRRFPAVCVNGLNEALTSFRLEQVLQLRSLLETASRRIAFSPAAVQPFPEDFPITRLGSMAVHPEPAAQSDKVVILLHESAYRPKQLRRMITEAFLGAPYPVEAWYPGCLTAKEGNLHFLPAMNYQTVNDAAVCVHDGSDALFNACLTAGIPQLVINNGSWQKNWNAYAVERLGAGVALTEDNLAMDTLYENYRRLVADDYFRHQAQFLAAQTAAMGSLEDIMQYF